VAYSQVLLALCIAMVNSGSGITAFYVILVTIGFCLFLTFAVRPAFMWVLRRTHSLQDGPTQGVMVLTVLMVRHVMEGAQDESRPSASAHILRQLLTSFSASAVPSSQAQSAFIPSSALSSPA
jgi:hypothetical protein